jgi:hypothetical protein
MLNQDNVNNMNREFNEKLKGMLELVARGRGIEILIRIVDQTREGLAAVCESYEEMMRSDLKIPNLHPPQSLPKLFTDGADRERLEAAQDIADKLAHGLYYQARELIDKYAVRFGIRTQLASDGLPGWRIDAHGHLLETDGRKIESIVDVLTTSKDNLLIEEYDIFVHNHYSNAASEIFEDAWRRISANQPALAVEVAKLHMFRGFRRGKRTYT